MNERCDSSGHGENDCIIKEGAAGSNEDLSPRDSLEKRNSTHPRHSQMFIECEDVFL